MFIALAASLCGAQGATDYAQFARSKQTLLEEILGPFSPPSHDTFSRIFRLLDPDAFTAAFVSFMQDFSQQLDGVVAIDGKAMRRAYEAGGRAWPPIIVSAFATDARCVLGSLKAGACGDGEAETAIRLIGLLRLDGATVTADALHCHRRMAAAITQRGGDYALCLKGNQSGLKKGNQSGLKKEAERLLTLAADDSDIASTDEISHGRRERRTARVISAGNMAQRHDFPRLEAIAEILCQRNDAPPHRRLFVLSRHAAASDVLAMVRAHWRIENTLHWTLDVTLMEDQARARKDNAPANFAQLARLATNILQNIDDPGTSIKSRIKKCAWEDRYLKNALAHMR